MRRLRSCVLAALILLTSVAPLRAAGAAPSAAADAADTDSLAVGTPSWDVTLGGETVFAIETAFKTIPPAERARLVSQRLESLARNPAFEPDSLRIEESEFSSDLVAGAVVAVAVLDADTTGTGMGRHALAMRRLQAVRAAIVRYRDERSMRHLSWAIAECLLATLVLIVGLMLLRRLRRRLGATLQQWIVVRRDAIKQRTHAILEPDRLLSALASLLTLLTALLSLMAIYVYASFVLGVLPWTHSFGTHLSELVLAPLRALGTGFVRNLPGLIYIVVVGTVTRYVLKLVGFIFAEIASGRIHLEKFYPEWAVPTERIIRLLIVAFALVIIYPAIPGSGSLAFKGISIFLGVLVSLGSTSMVGNLISGLMVVYMRSYRVGDIIQVGEQFGRVVETDLLATRLRTPWNVDITIPNSTMISSNIVNYSREADGQGLVLHSEVSIGYNAPWRQVHAMLLRAAALTDGILKEPAPYVLQRQLGDFAITYQINAYTHEPLRMLRIYHELHRNILDQFNEFGVEIMTPHYEGDRVRPALVPKDQWYAAPAIPSGQPGADQ